MLGDTKLKKLSKELHKLYSRKHDLSRKYEDTLSSGDKAEQINRDMEELANRIALFIENEYALAVFEEFNKTRPELIRVKTGETVTWEEGFGTDFEKISKSLRHSLVGLVEEPGRYKLR